MLVVMFILGMLFGFGLWVVIALIHDSRKKVETDGKWVKKRLFSTYYDNYCNEHGCARKPLTEPVEFGMCDEHYRKYWTFESTIPTKTVTEYKTYGWMEK